MIILTRENLEPLLSPAEAIELMRTVFREASEGRVFVPERSSINVGKENSILFMPGFVPKVGGLGIKLVSIFPTNQKKNIPTVSSLVMLHDPETGFVTAMLDGGWITALRTAAASALSVDLLAGKNAKTLGVFGAGVQARSHIHAIMAVRRVERILIFDPNQRKASDLSSEWQSSNDVSVSVAYEPSDAVRESDIIVTATTSAVPVFDGRNIRPGTHIVAIGSFKPHVRELDDATMGKARIFVDVPEAALKEAGDLLIPLKNGTITKNSILGGLADLVSGRVAGRTNEEEVTVFKSVGAAMEDIIVAARLLEKAKQMGLGREVSVV